MKVSINDAKLGQFLLRTRKINSAVLDRAVEIQTELPFLRLGEVLMGLRAISFKDLCEALYNQFSDALFGHVLLRREIATAEQIEAALAVQSQQDAPRKLGEILVEAGIATPKQIEEALEERELYHEYRFKLGFNRYFDEEFPQLSAEAAQVEDLPARWVQELSDTRQHPWTPQG